MTADAGRFRLSFLMAGLINLALGLATVLFSVFGDMPPALVVVALPGALIVIFTGLQLIRHARH